MFFSISFGHICVCNSKNKTMFVTTCQQCKETRHITEFRKEFAPKSLFCTEGDYFVVCSKDCSIDLGERLALHTYKDLKDEQIEKALDYVEKWTADNSKNPLNGRKIANNHYRVKERCEYHFKQYTKLLQLAQFWTENRELRMECEEFEKELEEASRNNLNMLDLYYRSFEHKEAVEEKETQDATIL
jgi:hypothetical protein